MGKGISHLISFQLQLWSAVMAKWHPNRHATLRQFFSCPLFHFSATTINVTGKNDVTKYYYVLNKCKYYVFDQEGFSGEFVLSKNVTVEKNTYIFTGLTDPKNDLMIA